MKPLSYSRIAVKLSGTIRAIQPPFMIGYKLHIDSADGGIPISCVLTSASTHNSQVAIPLAEMSHQRVTNLYDVKDEFGGRVVRVRGHEK